MEPLDEGQRLQLVSAMGRIRRVLDDERPAGGLVLRAPEPGDLGWVVERHGARYAAEHGWGASFEALVARIVADFGERVGHANAKPRGSPSSTANGSAASSAPRQTAPDTAQLRLLLVEPQARGAGVGTRLVDECLRFARRAGYRRIMLWTTDVQVEARRIYQRVGLSARRREPQTRFGHELVGEYWSRDL